jgi:hypothetical protein
MKFYSHTEDFFPLLLSGFSAKAMPDNTVGHTYHSCRRVIFAVRDLSEGGLTIISHFYGAPMRLFHIVV